MAQRRILSLILAALLLLTLTACTGKEDAPRALRYGSSEITRINPAIDEHGEINLLIFDGLTAHDENNAVVPALAESWIWEESTNTYIFHLREDVKWHDGEAFTAEDVKFTIEAIQDPVNESENASNYADVTEIEVIDEHTIAFTLAAPNVAFLDYMTMSVLPEHLLAGKDLHSDGFFRAPVGTGPYRFVDWEDGQAIVLERNEDYFGTVPSIERVEFRIVGDDSAKALQLRSGELDLALLTPKDAASFDGEEGFVRYDMSTSDYRGILFNFWNEYWQINADIIPAICCAIDREAIVDAVLLGQGEAAYSPLQRNQYNDETMEKYAYDPERAHALLTNAGCAMQDDGFYYRNGEKLGFVISVGAGDQVRKDIAMIAAQQLRQVGLDVSVDVPEVVDWGGQQAYLIGWGSPFDADDHTYKVFGTDQGANYSGYSNAAVDAALTEARSTDDKAARQAAYAAFLKAFAENPPYALICYIDANYVASDALEGISEGTVMGHHGVGIFHNIENWSWKEA